MSILETEQLGVRYAGLVALADLNLRIEPGSFVGLIGANGAGKTTCIDALTGLVQAQGQIRFDGRRIEHLPPHRRAALGMARTFQSLELFEDLTVRHNLSLSAEAGSSWRFLRDILVPHRGRVPGALKENLDLLGLSGMEDRMPSDLSHGQRKLVGVARALAGSPRLLLLDEPAAGLDSTESRQFGRKMRRLVENGLSILVIEHDMDLIFDVCDYVYVLEFGRQIAEGTPQTIRSDTRVIQSYLGSSHAEAGVPNCSDSERTGVPRP